MRISTLMSYAQGYVGATKEISEMEKAGLDVVWVPEAYSFDAPSAMGYLAAKTESVTIASGILPIYSRTPTLLAMTAAGIDALPEGRCMLGLGAGFQLPSAASAGSGPLSFAPAAGSQRSA